MSGVSAMKAPRRINVAAMSAVQATSVLVAAALLALCGEKSCAGDAHQLAALATFGVYVATILFRVKRIFFAGGGAAKHRWWWIAARCAVVLEFGLLVALSRTTHPMNVALSAALVVACYTLLAFAAM